MSIPGIHSNVRIPALVGSTIMIAAVLVLTPGASRETPATGSLLGMVGLTGGVTYSGAAPSGTPIDMSGDRYCGGVNAGRQVLQRAVVADGSGGLANVIVYIRGGSSGAAHPVPSDSVLLDQVNCMYEPHVVAVRKDQPLIIRNSDATLHNVHVRSEHNREFNIGQPMKGVRSVRRFGENEVGIHVTCDIHGWMNGVIAVFDHPWFAVTGSDGSFSIDGLPAGDYVVEAWHETLGVREQQVTVGAGAATEVNFTFGGD